MRVSDFVLRSTRAVVGTVPLPGRYVAADLVGRVAAPESGAVTGKLGRYLVEYDLHDELQRQMYFGLYDPTLTTLLRRRLHPGEVFYDVGANVGYFTLLASGIVGSAGEVHAFEPIRANVERLRTNVRRNGITNITINEMAVADRAGEVSLYVPESDGAANSGWASIAPSARRPAAITVPTVSLDEYASGRRMPALIKLDIEGSEPAALAGMRELLGRDDAPDLVVEVNTFLLDRLGRSPAAVIGPLESAGNELFAMHDHGIAPLTVHPEFDKLTDVYATKRGA